MRAASLFRWAWPVCIVAMHLVSGGCEKSLDDEDLIITVSGHVRDAPASTPLVEATLTCTGVVSLGPASTDSLGFYRLHPNTFGTLEVRCSKIGYGTQTDTIIMSQPTRVYYVNFTLVPLDP